MKYIKYNINQYFNSYLLGLKYIDSVEEVFMSNKTKYR